MPTIEENRSLFDETYDWPQAGEEWSRPWGNAHMQWYGSILPRISAFVPTDTILEVAPGYGRWTVFLKDLCKRLIIVDLSERCIDICRQRFADCSHISYFVNDGRSLEMVADDSVDFIFSFDSLVHVEDTVIKAYTAEFAKKLRPNGAAFLHHSNAGEYLNRVKAQRQLSKIPKLLGLLIRLGIFDDVYQLRAKSMTAAKMAMFAQEHNLQCVSQELVTWYTRSVLIDCFSTLVRCESRWSRQNRVLRNAGFMREAKRLSDLSSLYEWPSATPWAGRIIPRTRSMASRNIVGASALRNFLRQRAYPAFCEGLAVAGRPLLLSRAEDVTSQTATRSCLVLAPHPDDETLGCGATIIRKLATGTPVQVVIAADGRYEYHPSKLSVDAQVEIREEEARQACAVLGLPSENITFLRFEDRRLADHRGLLRERLFDIFDTMNPEEILVSSVIDNHPDHRVLAELGRELAQARRDRVRVLYEYPIWFWDPRILRVRDLLALRPRIVRTGEFRMRKHAAIAAYHSQVTNIIGDTRSAPLRKGFLRQFLQPEEIFFEVSVHN